MVSQKSQKAKKSVKQAPKGDRLRQKNQIPQSIRDLVGDDEKCNNLYLSWGVDGVGQRAKVITPEAQRTQDLRKLREVERRSAGAEGTCAGGARTKKTTGRNKSRQPSAAQAAPVPIPSVLPPPPLISHGTYHEWSIHPTLSPSTLAATAKQHSPATPSSHTFPSPSNYPPFISTNVPRQGFVLGHYVDDPVELGYPYAPASATGSTEPKSLYAARDAFASQSPPTTPGLDTDCGSPSACSSSPRSPVLTEAPGCNAARPSVLMAGSTSPLSDVQDSEKNNDLFSAVYEESFIRRSSGTRRSSPQPPPPVLSRDYIYTPYPVDHQPQHYQAYSPESAPIDNAFRVTAMTATVSVERECQDMRRCSYAAHTAQSEGREPMAWSAPSFCAARAGAERSDYAMDDAYAYVDNVQVQSPLVAEQMNYSIHPSPIAPRGLYSAPPEQAPHFSPPRSFTEDSDDALSTMDSPSLRTDSSDIDTPSRIPRALSYPQHATISTDECARLFDECFDANENLLLEASSLLVDMALPAGLCYDIYY